MKVYNIKPNGIVYHKCQSRDGCNNRALYDVIDPDTGKRFHACIIHGMLVKGRQLGQELINTSDEERRVLIHAYSLRKYRRQGSKRRFK